VALDIDVVVDTDTAHAPFGEGIGLGRQGFEPQPIEFFEELPAGHPEPADRSLPAHRFRDDLAHGSHELSLTGEFSGPITQTKFDPDLLPSLGDIWRIVMPNPIRSGIAQIAGVRNPVCRTGVQASTNEHYGAVSFYSQFLRCPPMTAPIIHPLRTKRLHGRSV
jgi:hypothetical protein